MTTMFKVGEEYKTRGGNCARIYATDAAYGNIHGAILFSDGWYMNTWDKDGGNIADRNSLISPRKKALVTTKMINAWREEEAAYPSCLAIVEAWRDAGCPVEEEN
jgi:hypothetical protein